MIRTQALASSGWKAATLAAGVLLWSAGHSARAQEAAPAADAAAPAGETPPPANAQFDIMEYLVQGNTVLPTADIEEAVYPHLGPEKSIDDVERARAALEQRYADQGFITVVVNIPEQTVAGGVVTLEVVEGRVGRLRVREARYYSLGRIRNAAPSLAEGKVPNLNAVQADIEKLNYLPGRRVTPILKAGVAPETVDADLRVEDEKPYRVSAEINNYQSADTEPLRFTATASYDNLFQLGHSLGATYTVAPQDRDEVEVFSLSYTARLPERPESLRFYGFSSSSNVATVGGTEVVGDGFVVGTRLIKPLPSLGDVRQTLIAGVDYKSFDDTQNFAEARFETPVDYVPVSLDYLANWRGERSSTLARLGVTAGTGLGSTAGEFTDKRANATPTFAYLTAGLERLQNLPRGFDLVGRFDGQLSKDPLINNEQFAAGGITSVRGYLEAEELGDSGVAASLQLESPDLAPRLPGEIGSRLRDLRLYAFAEGAHLWQVESLPGEDETFDLVSTGIGTRFTVFDYAQAAFDIAVPLRKTERHDPGDVRVLFSLGAGL